MGKHPCNIKKNRLLTKKTQRFGCSSFSFCLNHRRIQQRKTIFFRRWRKIRKWAILCSPLALTTEGGLLQTSDPLGFCQWIRRGTAACCSDKGSLQCLSFEVYRDCHPHAGLVRTDNEAMRFGAGTGQSVLEGKTIKINWKWDYNKMRTVKWEWLRLIWNKVLRGKNANAVNR